MLGEGAFAAARREVLEECGLVVRSLGVLSCVHLESEGFTFEIHEVLCVPDAAEGALRAGADAGWAGWLSPHAAAALGADPQVVQIALRAVRAIALTAPRGGQYRGITV